MYEASHAGLGTGSLEERRRSDVLSIPDQIAALEELAAVDAKLRELDDELGKERGTLAGMRENLEKISTKLETDRAALSNMEKTRNEYMQDVRNMHLQLDHSRDKLNRSRTERESNAAQRELEELRKLIRDREEDVTRIETEAGGARTQIEEA